MRNNIARSQRTPHGCGTLFLLAALFAAGLFPFGADFTVMASAADNVWSVEYLNSRRDEWDSLIGPRIMVEGRVTLAGKEVMRLQKCEMSFRVTDAQIRQLNGHRVVEVAGRLKKESGKIVFQVEQVKAIPTDSEQYDSRVSKWKQPRAADWFELGDWATHRSHFYDDADLAKKATAAYLRAVKLEIQSLPNGDAEARYKLAARIGQLKLNEDLRHELLHEGMHLEFQAAAKAKGTAPEVFQKLATRIGEELPGSLQSLAQFPPVLFERYEREPLVVYTQSNGEARVQMHRMLYAAVTLKPILNEAEDDGKNGDTIAERIERAIPERKDLAEAHRLKKLEWRVSRIAITNRQDIEQLVGEFRSRSQPDRATQILKTWLQSREKRLRDEGALGLLQLADEYLDLLKDEPKAVALLSEANKLDPTFTEVVARLNSLGYGLDRGRWEKTGPKRTTTENPVPVVPTVAGVSVGMTAAALRTVLGGPDVVSKAYSAQGVVTEVWAYGQLGSSRIVIRLERAERSRELKVAEVTSTR